jgi:hypothetical protein
LPIINQLIINNQTRTRLLLGFGGGGGGGGLGGTGGGGGCIKACVAWMELFAGMAGRAGASTRGGGGGGGGGTLSFVCCEKAAPAIPIASVRKTMCFIMLVSGKMREAENSIKAGMEKCINKTGGL